MEGTHANRLIFARISPSRCIPKSAVAPSLLCNGRNPMLGVKTLSDEKQQPMRAIPSVLVIDDNFGALKALNSLMTALGAERVCEAESAEEALQLIDKERFDLIVSDYRLEGMNGVEFLEQVRAQGNQTPILLLSGAPDKAGVIRATQQPKADFFAKPFKIVELTDAMNRLLAA
jgi:DNA-binding NtrC family response regulator